MRILLALLLLLLLLATTQITAADWPQWRGINYDGISQETVPQSLPDELPVLWTAKVHIGFSTVSVQGERVLTMGNQDDVDTIWCLNADSGEVLWKHSYPCALDPRYYEGGPSATPTIHEGAVYTFSRKGHAFRLDLESGQVIWSRDLVKDHELDLPEWSFASSPVLFEGRVLLNAGRQGIALDRETGETLWLPSQESSGYASMVPFTQADSQVTHLLFSAKSLFGIDARTGKSHWEYPWRSSRDVNAADPVIEGSQVLISSSRGAALLEIHGDGKEPSLVWEQPEMRWYFNAGVKIGDHVYSLHGTTHRPTELLCVEFATGKRVWSEDGFGSGALMAAGNTLILFDEGKLTLFPATPEGYQPFHEQTILKGKCWTVPVLANGRIYCRNAAGDLACVALPDGA